MARTPQQVPSLSGEHIAELLGLLKGADTVELKLTVPESTIALLRHRCDSM